MGGPNIGRFDFGFNTARELFQNLIEDRVMEALKTPVKAGDNTAAKKRFENVRELLQQFNPQQAGELLDHLNESHPKDPLAKEIKYRFSDSSAEELKKNLEMVSGRWVDKHLGLEGSLRKRQPKDIGGELKSETEAAGKAKRSRLEEIWNAHTNEEKIHSALASSNGGVDEKAISEILSNLTNEEKKQLKRAYKEKYGENLLDAIKSQFGGGFFGAAVGVLVKNMLD